MGAAEQRFPERPNSPLVELHLWPEHVGEKISTDRGKGRRARCKRIYRNIVKGGGEAAIVLHISFYTDHAGNIENKTAAPSVERLSITEVLTTRGGSRREIRRVP